MRRAHLAEFLFIFVGCMICLSAGPVIAGAGTSDGQDLSILMFVAWVLLMIVNSALTGVRR